MDSDALVLLIVAATAILATGFTVAPILPGTLFVPLGAAACALVVGWDEFAWWFWLLQALLVGAYLVLDNVAQVLGVRRMGGSRQAMLGGAVGVVAGPILLAFVLGPFALFIGPPVGAVVGTLVGEERARRADATGPASRAGYHRLGFGALAAYVLGTVLKLAVVAVQVVLLAVAAW